jgi:hypothetical protein
MNNLPPHVRNRVNKIIEDCGGDIDYSKIQKYVQKCGFEYNVPPAGGTWDKGGNPAAMDHMKMNAGGPGGGKVQQGIEP